MLRIQYFIPINLLCLIVNTLSWYERVHEHDRFHGSSNYEHCGTFFLFYDNYDLECGKKTVLSASKIIGGQEIFENEFPWMAGIVSVNRLQVICGASIINDRYVITAAHCIIYGKDDLKVSVGAHNSCKWDAKSTIFSVKSIFPHPNYKRETNFADIMLVKLIMKITFNEFVRPICLPKLGLDAVSEYEGQSVSALGWGLSENDFFFNKECGLRVVDLTLFKQSDCPTEVSTLLCAGYKESSRGTCGGDSGGPLQILDEDYKYVLIGITSSGVLCADVNYPDFYTDVTQMVSWILQITKRDSKYCWY